MISNVLSLVLPVHNEQEVIAKTYEALKDFGDRVCTQGISLEIVFVNDGSRDRSPEFLDQFAEHDERVTVIHLARNFGHQAAVSAGLDLASGDLIAVMDSDLQDPPEALLPMIDKWREGYQVVYAVREKRKESWWKKAGYWAFYRALKLMSEIDIPLDSGDFCLMDRSALDLLKQLPEKQRFVRGLRSWIGLKQIGVTYERAARAAGTPSYRLWHLIKLAMDGFVGFSNLPLRLVTRIGFFGLASAIFLGLWVLSSFVYESLSGYRTPRGWASLACLVLFTSSLQLISLGIMGEYLARIFLEVKQRPTYLIAKVVKSPKTATEQ
jgi:polyisoprenyl-phosphate glycosyltransferase